MSASSPAVPRPRGKRSAPLVVVVYKKSAYQLYAVEKKDPRVRRLLKDQAKAVRQLSASHNSHEHSLHTVLEAARRSGARVRSMYRANLGTRVEADLVVAVGGDGTVLETSHKISGATELLGVNSNPERSVGYLTGCHAAGFEDMLQDILRGRHKPMRLLRMAVHLNGALQGVPVLNDVLFCHSNPAATSRYLLRTGSRSEEQKSSGLWIATPAGSTAAVASAGGKPDSLKARRFQYVVREPYAPPGLRVRMRMGFFPHTGSLTLESFMRDASVYLDGSHLRIRLGMGDVVELRAHPDPLLLHRGTPSSRG